MTEQELRTEIADEYGDDSDVYKMLLDLIDERDHYRHVGGDHLENVRYYWEAKERINRQIARYEAVVEAARHVFSAIDRFGLPEPEFTTAEQFAPSLRAALASLDSTP